ncbi:MAG: hypothetical protein JJE29_08830 [Peptostreptococcaceae bacterium]|nr:hypothetical protein [Peptostreptococcaceae bacterium]
MTSLNIDRKKMVSVTDMTRKPGKFIEKAKESPVFIIKNNAIASVLINIEEYEKLLDKLRVQEEALEYAAIAKIVVERKKDFSIEDALNEEDIMKFL